MHFLQDTENNFSKCFLTGCKRCITQWVNSAFILYFKVSPFPYHWPQFYSFPLLSKTNKGMFNAKHVLRCSAGAVQTFIIVEAGPCRGCCGTPVLGKLANPTPQAFAELGICSITPRESLCMWGVRLFSLIENGSWNVALCPFLSGALRKLFLSFLCILCQIFFSLSKAGGPWTSWWFYIPGLCKCSLAQLSGRGMHAVGGM